MSDEQQSIPVPDETPGAAGAGEPGTVSADADSASDAASAWREVVEGLDALSEAIGRWAKAAVNDPENKRRADELSAKLEGFVSEVGDTIKGAGESEVGQSFREAADKTGDAFRQAGEKLSEEIGPKLSGAFKSAAERLGQAAQRIEQRSGTVAGPAEDASDSAGDQATDGD
ncbi:MAG: hypothetical protein JXP72_00675 [Coriobacteriia bacterium]|nr:hypothetical protein [Coriobacteriia bacterium]